MVTNYNEDTHTVHTCFTCGVYDNGTAKYANTRIETDLVQRYPAG